MSARFTRPFANHPDRFFPIDEDGRALAAFPDAAEPQQQATEQQATTKRSTNRIAAKPRSPRMLLSNRSNAAQGLK